MFGELKREWSQLRKGRPGSRFRLQYDRNRKEQVSAFGRLLRIVIGLLLFPVGVFFLAVPGPGLVVIAIGAVLIAREFRWAAQALDRIEVRGRQAVTAVKRRWHAVAGGR